MTELLKPAVYNEKEINIMFTITRKEYEEIVGLISRCCCPCTGRHEHCAETECDVQIICEILWEHLERNDIKSDRERTVIEWTREEANIDLDDKFPFREL